MTENDPAREQSPSDPTAAEKLKSQAGSASGASGGSIPEKELWSGTYSGKAMVGAWIGVVLLAIVLIGLGIWMATGENGWGQTAMWVCVGIGLIALLGTFIVQKARQWSVSYRLTSHRLYHTEGLINRANDRIRLIDVNDVSYSQGLFQRMFDVGTVKVESNDSSHPIFEMKGIAEPAKVADHIDNARLAALDKKEIFMN